MCVGCVCTISESVIVTNDWGLPAPQPRVEKAGEIVREFVTQHGMAHLLDVADELGHTGEGGGIDYAGPEEDPASHIGGKLKISLSDLQMIAFAGALAARREALRLGL